MLQGYSLENCAIHMRVYPYCAIFCYTCSYIRDTYIYVAFPMLHIITARIPKQKNRYMTLHDTVCDKSL